MVTQATESITTISVDSPILQASPYGDSLMVFTLNQHDAAMLPRLFINAYANSNGITVTREIDRMALLMGNPKDPQELRKSLYDLFLTHHRRGNDYIRTLIEQSLIDTENHPSSSPHHRPYNIVGVDLSVIPAAAVNHIRMKKLALLPAAYEHDVTQDPEFPDCDNFIYHHKASPELHATARSYMMGQGFDV